MKKDSLKNFNLGGMDSNSSPENILANDYQVGYNIRISGTGEEEGGYVSNIESTEPVTETTNVPPGIIKGIGGGEFDDIQQAVMFRYNSFGNNQILVYDYATNEIRAIFTDKTDTSGKVLLPLDPENYIKAILVNEKYLVWVGTDLEVGYTNLQTLASGGYGSTVLAEDISLIKPQCLIPPTGVYGDDAGQPSNDLFGKLPQFIVQYVNADYNYSAWSTRSKRIVPYQQNTPTLGADVTKNNYIIVSLDIGSIRAAVINVGCRMGNDNFDTIKSVDRSHIIALTDTSLDVDNLIYEAYDPATNLYSFAFYNNNVVIPIDPNITDNPYPYIWPSNAIEKINGNIIALADWKTLYERPTTPVTINSVGYNPNIDIPVGGRVDPFKAVNSTNDVDTNKKKSKIRIYFGGTPHTGDVIKVVIVDKRDANNIIVYSYTVPSSQDGDFDKVVKSFSEVIPRANHTDPSDVIQFVTPEYFKLQSFNIQLSFDGATVSNSIPTVLDNCPYQLALAHFDKWGRYLPLETNDGFKTVTPSYAQLNGNAVQISWDINSPIAPVGAVSYQWLITKPPVDSILDTLAVLLTYKGTWDSFSNTPPLAANTGVFGDTYQITNPSNSSDTGHYVNLGSGSSYDTGDYITFNGKSWDVLPKDFGDLTTAGNILAFSLNPLKLFNDQYANEGVDTVLGYDFSVGDRCTLHYYIDGDGNKVFLNNPCVNLSVFGYDSGNYIVKVEKSATFDIRTELTGKNVFLRLYSPAKSDNTPSDTQNTTVWYEVGIQYPIVNGQYTTLSGIINDGGAYYKTRQFDDAVDPYTNPPVSTLATDLNYSDFYPSQFSSFGRPRTYYDELEKTERKANIITSQNYILGSKQNGLTTFYQADVYGDTNGQTSSSYGAIQALWQRGQVLVVLQELNIFYIPVNEAYVVLNDEITGQSISEKLLNNGRYETKGIGVGKAKEAFTYNENVGWIIDPNRSEPFEISIGGVNSIAGKMSKYFKSVFANAYAQGKKIVLFYNRYYNEVMVCVQADGGVLTLYPFASTDWQIANGFNILPSDVTATNNGSHSTASYNSTTGKVTYTPTSGYVGSDKATFVFNANGSSHTVNNCLLWTAASITPDGFSFGALTNLPLSTLEQSNIILVSGINVPVPISITGGQYSINGGAFTSASGTVVNGDTVQVQITSSASSTTETHCDLTISTETERFSVTTGSNVVDAFSFPARAGVTTSTAITSASITVSGNTIPAPISISGGTYSVNGGAFISASGFVNAGDIVSVRVTSSSSVNTLTSTMLTIDGKNATFNVTTYYVNAFPFTAQTGVALSSPITSNIDTITGSSDHPLPISVTGGQYSINGGAFTSSAGTINIGDTLQARVTSSSIGSTETHCIITIGTVTQAFSVTTYAGTFSLTVNITEVATPYSDANVEVKLNSVELARLTGNGTYNFTPNIGGVLSIEAFSEKPSTGSNPTKTLKVTLNSTVVYGPTTNSNNPGDPSLFWNSYTPVNGDVIIVDESATATPFASDVTGILVVDIYNDTTLNVIGYVNTIGTTPYQVPAYTGHNFVPGISTPPENNWVLASDLDTDPTLKWRFEFNIAQLLSVYPSATSFDFVISGRGATAGTLNGQYQQQNGGKMIMSGTTGSYLPSTSGTTVIGSPTLYSGKPVVNGANGTYGIGVGAVIMTFTYNVASKTITLV